MYSNNTSHQNLTHIVYTNNAGGNVTKLISASDNSIVNTYEYSPFGETITSTETVENPYRYNTKYTDDESGLVYYGFRYYDAENGRWLNRDPIGTRGGINLYASMSNNMVNGFSGGRGWSGGAERTVGNIVDSAGVDAWGNKIFFRVPNGNAEQTEIFKAIQILYPKVKARNARFTRRGYYCIELPEGAKETKLSQQLIRELSDAPKNLYITNERSKRGPGASFDPNNYTIHFPTTATNIQRFVTLDFPGQGVIPKVFVTSTSPSYFTMAHEMIHAYYFLKGKTKGDGEKTPNLFYWATGRIGNIEIRENNFLSIHNGTSLEEFYTIGASLVTVDFAKKFSNVIFYAGKYTENEIRKEFNYKEYRVAHIVYSTRLATTPIPIREGFQTQFKSLVR